MAGTCIATVKIVGVSSLGLLTSSLTFQTIQRIPELINELNTKVNGLSKSNALASIRNMINFSRIGHIALSGLATAMLSMAFIYSPPSEKHPYLIYSALGAPLALISMYYRGFGLETKLLRKADNLHSHREIAKTTDNVSDSENVKSDDDSQLGKSYIHVSDEESSSTTSTPTSTVPSSPQTKTVDSLQEELSLEEEIDNALSKKEIINDLNKVKSNYVVGSSIVGLSFVIATIGLIGDYYLL
ncbi:uncharacterized protein AC631_05182 [Debaryomyces fabryi]|uniref:Autophagy-related protein 33 n=1 Tax=Debaryomyces fabryi TaxID=58627 RepID=A0A0V1PS47_9ASCO|nr:uncharacterized protein AC631_05182 [Debaryomyces fabryi]KRZ99056.1 hypothetical protein AC631_05182 [Debaryomyces fabryi]CUM45387.1 unnamed protein product [Debaryomyces fabryi]